MTPTASRPPEPAARAPEKPPAGAPCNGCGLCCAAVPCQLAREYLGATRGPCPAMEFTDGAFRCGMVARPHRYLGTPAQADAQLAPGFAELLGVGRGCDSDVSGG